MHLYLRQRQPWHTHHDPGGKMGITPEATGRTISQGTSSGFNGFYIEFDNYYTTHSPENKELVETVFQRHVKEATLTNASSNKLMIPKKICFCPIVLSKANARNCGAKDQYGDNCEVCGATYSPTELKNPYSTLSGAKPIEKESEHYFFKLQNYEKMLHEWTRNGHLQEQVTNKLDEWFKEGLQEWDISRDAPYFGFKIPGEEDKYFYFWLDAPIGYMASFKNLCEQKPGFKFR